jgi:N-acylneuraminate cytidylyltransferase
MLSDTVNTLAVIPARGGSKRVPGKNVKEVGGKPLIAHTIDQAARADRIDRAIVSTDDDEIADIAREYGGDVPFDRPESLATDDATSPPVIEHALDWVETNGKSPETVVMLQVTTPLRTADDIDETVQTLHANEQVSSALTVSEFDTPPQWALEMADDGRVNSHFDHDVLWVDEIPRSQDLETLYYPDGAVFAADVETFRETTSFYTETTLGVEMPPERSLDIDEPYELELARQLIETREADPNGDGE